MTAPHDHLFRLVFADPEHAGPLLRSALPAVVAEAVDWTSLRRCEPVQQGRRGRATICDLLFATRLRAGGELLVYLVLEHKSQSSRFDALQMLEQVTAVLRTHRREHPRERFLPPVLPIVVHADHRRWRSPLQVRELFDLESIPIELHRYLPALAFVLDDLRDAPPARLRQRALSVFGLCTLATLQYLPPAARSEAKLAAWFEAWSDVQERAARLAETAAGTDVFDAVVDYVLATSSVPRSRLRRLLEGTRNTPAMKKKFVSTLEQTRNEGRSEGRSEGLSEGRSEGLSEGRAEGMADTLVRLLSRRFGAAATAAVEHRIRTASREDLEQFTDRVLDAATLDAVFAAD